MDLNFILITGSACAIGFYMAWSIGANDVANAMATAVGAKAISYKQAVILAGILNFLGALCVGSHVTETIKGNIVNPVGIEPNLLLIGFASSLLAAAIFVTISTWKEMPISTTHSIVGALVGFGLITSGIYCINWVKLGTIAASWLLSPLVGLIFAFIIFKIIVKLIFVKDNPVKSAKIVGPGAIGFTAFMMVSTGLIGTSLGKTIGITDTLTILLLAISAGLIITFLAMYKLRKVHEKSPQDYETVENMFRRLQIATSCYVAFAIGANDVANAIGPVAGIISLSTTGTIDPTTQIPLALLAFGGVGIAVGCLTWGHKVMKTLGFKITTLTNTRGFSIDVGTATTVLLASMLGLPVSTSHTVVGAVIGVGLAKGIEAIDLKIIKKIVSSWLLTVPSAAALSAIIFIALKVIFGL